MSAEGEENTLADGTKTAYSRHYVACPKCGARPYEHCVGLEKGHEARVEAWHEQGQPEWDAFLFQVARGRWEAEQGA